MASKFSPGQLREMKQAFDLFDRDRSGSISFLEMKNVFRSFGVTASDEEIKVVVKQMDKNRDGTISFDEFIQVMGSQFYRKYTDSEIRRAFKYFDADNSGYITANELKNALLKLGRHYTDREISQMVRSVDKNRDGHISIEEFAQLLQG